MEKSDRGIPDESMQGSREAEKNMRWSWGSGETVGKAGEWKEIRLLRMELYYISSRKFSLLKRFFT